MLKRQTLENKQGEVSFRKILVKQFQGISDNCPGHPTCTEYSSIVKDQIQYYTNYFTALSQNQIPISPYLELGGGIGHAAMLLENTFSAQGFTCDISYDTLRLASRYKKELRFAKLPIRICCDIYNLPFQTGSIPFVFTFQTLHHLPDPKPVLSEVKRVLSPNGYFYVNEEPIAQLINLNLWRRDRNLTWFEKVLKAAVVLHFISRIGKSEVDHHILEETFSLDTWERALSVFPDVTARLKAFPFGPTIHRVKNSHSHWLTPPLLQNAILQILGGGIEALCKTENGTTKKKAKNLLDLLACPNCRHKPKLLHYKEKKMLYCGSCKHSFEEKNGVWMLLTTEAQKTLYSL